MKTVQRCFHIVHKLAVISIGSSEVTVKSGHHSLLQMFISTENKIKTATIYIAMKEREWFPWQMIICVLDEGRIPMVLGKAYTSVCAWRLQKLPPKNYYWLRSQHACSWALQICILTEPMIKTNSNINLSRKERRWMPYTETDHTWIWKARALPCSNNVMLNTCLDFGSEFGGKQCETNFFTIQMIIHNQQNIITNIQCCTHVFKRVML